MGVIKGMSGFGVVRVYFQHYSLECILRTFNHRYMEIHISLPDEIAEIEANLRKRLKQAIKRGYVQLNIQLHIDNKYAREHLKSLAYELNDQFSGQNVRFIADTEKVMYQYIQKDLKLLKTVTRKKLEEVLDQVMEMRRWEGRSLARDISRLVAKAKNALKECDEIQKRIISSIRADKTKNSEEKMRLLKNIDIHEEVTRAKFFLQEIKLLLGKEKREHGRILDFYSQELLRESSTILTKVTDKNAKKAVVMLKAYCESIRQQVQNIE